MLIHQSIVLELPKTAHACRRLLKLDGLDISFDACPPHEWLPPNVTRGSAKAQFCPNQETCPPSQVFMSHSTIKSLNHSSLPSTLQAKAQGQAPAVLPPFPYLVASGSTNCVSYTVIGLVCFFLLQRWFFERLPLYEETVYDFGVYRYGLRMKPLIIGLGVDYIHDKPTTVGLFPTDYTSTSLERNRHHIHDADAGEYVTG